ncbi:MAG: Bug family tripartite tricarboxylate transporter substrate binding protein [Burkholderiales bacterium]
MSCTNARGGVRAAALGVALVAGSTGAAFAQDYPARNITVIVPYSAGGSADLMTRTMAQQLSKAWERNVVVDNWPGASGMIGTELVTKAQPDGYTLLGSTSSFPATASVRAKLPFDPAKAIVPVATYAKAPNLMAIHVSVPAKSVKELIELAKKKELTYGSSGAGGNNHFSGALFAAAADIKMTHVPYKGIAPAVTSLAGGEIDLIISSAAALGPQMDAGRIRILGVTSLKPSPLFPNLPSVAESGAPGYEYELWWGLFAPAGLPADRLAFINAAVNKILASPEMKKFLAREKAEAWPQTPQQLEGFLVREIERYRKTAQIAGIKPL